MDQPLTYIGRTNGRSSLQTVFGIKQTDRFSHTYVIGRTGTGKTTLLETMALQDIRAGRGIALLDPHGDLAARLVAQVPAIRAPDLVYLNIPDPNQPYGYNPLGAVAPDRVPLAAGGLLAAFEKIWGEREWGARMSHVLRFALYALIEYGHATLPDVLRLLADKEYQAHVLGGVQNSQVREFWLNEYAKYPPAYRQQCIAPIQNKIGAFLADPRLYRVFAGSGNRIDIRRLMDDGKILVVNLAKGAMSEDSASLFGALLVSTMSAAAFSRIDTPEAARRDFIVYIDEFQSFTTLAVATMISELRKMKIGLVLSHQHLEQLGRDVRSAVLGNVGTTILFRLGAEDAQLFAREFAPTFEAIDLMHAPNHTIRIKLMIDGEPSKAFSATTLTPEALLEHTRERAA
jgi:hypothetical protein